MPPRSATDPDGLRAHRPLPPVRPARADPHRHRDQLPRPRGGPGPRRLRGAGRAPAPPGAPGRASSWTCAQTETMISLLGPAVLDFTVNGRVEQPQGNLAGYAAPHGVYPCRGDDRWVTLSVADGEQWRALLDELDAAELARDERFATLRRPPRLEPRRCGCRAGRPARVHRDGYELPWITRLQERSVRARARHAELPGPGGRRPAAAVPRSLRGPGPSRDGAVGVQLAAVHNQRSRPASKPCGRPRRCWDSAPARSAPSSLGLDDAAVDELAAAGVLA